MGLMRYNLDYNDITLGLMRHFATDRLKIHLTGVETTSNRISNCF